MSYYVMNSGKIIDMADIDEDDICLHDIAHHLTKLCRYGGALDFNMYYSVAQHSLQLTAWARSNNYPVEIQRCLLMHDASEAYLGDIIKGLKNILPDYKNIEEKLENILNVKYTLNMSREIKKIIKELDTRILLDEAAFFMPENAHVFKDQLVGVTPLGVHLYNEKDLVFTYNCFLETCDILNITD